MNPFEHYAHEVLFALERERIDRRNERHTALQTFANPSPRNAWKPRPRTWLGRLRPWGRGGRQASPTIPPDNNPACIRPTHARDLQ